MPKGEHRQNARVVSHCSLHRNQSPGFIGSHLCCASTLTMQCQLIVKLHRVFSSFRDLPGICTRIAISPSLASRQCPDRYTIRAGRNFIRRERKTYGFPLTSSPFPKRCASRQAELAFGTTYLDWIARDFPPVGETGSPACAGAH